MITPSLIYIAVTVLLAFIDAYRIKKAKGIVENINHFWSWLFAAVSILILAVLYGNIVGPRDKLTNGFLSTAILAVSFVAIRLVFFDPLLNIARRMKIDYVSTKTNSYEDQHTNKLSFWEKRAIGVAGWGICLIVYHIIFKR